MRRSSTVGTWLFKLPNYGKHWLRVLVCAILLIAPMTLFALLLGFLVFPEGAESATACLSRGLWLLYDLVSPSDVDALREAAGDCLVLYRIAGFAIAAVIAGAIFAACVRPVHILRLSKHGVVDLEKEELQFRFWVMTGYKGCLYDVSVELIIAAPEHYGMSTARLHWPFRYSAPKDCSGGYGSYSVVHGVWTFSIPLDANGGDGRELHSFFDSKTSKGGSDPNSGYSCRVRVRGSSKDGRIYYCEQDYALEDIYVGGEFAPLAVEKGQGCGWFDKGMNYHGFDVICVQHLSEESNKYGLRTTKLFGDRRDHADSCRS